jgi:hypothetical protein
VTARRSDQQIKRNKTAKQMRNWIRDRHNFRLAASAVFIFFVSGMILLFLKNYSLLKTSFGPKLTEKHEIKSVQALNYFFTFSENRGRVKEDRFEIICLTGNYANALDQTKFLLNAKGLRTDFPPLQAAGTFQDQTNVGSESAIVLLSQANALILILEKKYGMSVGEIGCENTNSAAVERRDRDFLVQGNTFREFYLLPQSAS